MSKQETAVEWLKERFHKYVAWTEGESRATPYNIADLSDDFQQAKEMEKEQIISAKMDSMTDDELSYTTAEDYYNQTYGGEK